MKKLEALLNKVVELLDLCDIRSYDIPITIISLVMMILYEGLGIWMAVVGHFYLVLSITTFLWVWMITECFIKKIFFKKLNDYLLETPKATTLIFWILLIFSIILSWKYFIGFILSVILAFMLADFIKNKEKE